ncbi:glutaredoxin domain-containing cysteine-rich protein CG31559 [Drosophila kikkawai]|uniref:Glutaredoxin domain-containing cysteine-rich protein CG31559 n=1 Tax=Drosophila kikkawai TaxID=30033 RepID=A0A6P4HXF5_DROKI|nr:glutaredoxin domain-containing cysteine-rich protein CG31559 [Drosophila kikkawai]
MVLATPPVGKGGSFMEQYQQYSAHCEAADSGNGSDLESNGIPAKPDDSEESGPSSLGSDSMHGSSTEYVRQAASQPSGQRQRQKSLRALGALLPDSLLRDIRDRRGSEFVVQLSSKPEEKKIQAKAPEQQSSPLRLARESLSEEKIEELRAAVERANFVQTGEETLDSIEAAPQSLPASSSNINYKYADDQYYSFHINEHENFPSFPGNGDEVDHSRGAGAGAEAQSGILTEQQDLFAGYRDVRCGAGSTQSTIRSAKGTVRGVRNRVRNGIATFLQLHQQPNAKNFKEKDLGKVVLYTTSMGIIRDTYTKCANVKQILRTLLVKFEERDVFMSVEYQAEMRQRMQAGQVRVPQLYVEGQHIGDAETVERLNESGELRQLLKPYKSMASTFTCQTCGGYRLLPCPSCNGSKKSVHRNHFTAEFVALKCMNCDEVGLVKCHSC